MSGQSYYHESGIEPSSSSDIPVIPVSFCFSDNKLNLQKGLRGPNCWGLGFCTAEIVDAILRNTRIVLPASTHIPVIINPLPSLNLIHNLLKSTMIGV